MIRFIFPDALFAMKNRVTFCRNFLTEIFKREEWTLVKDILNIVERRWSPDESADEIENI